LGGSTRPTIADPWEFQYPIGVIVPPVPLLEAIVRERIDRVRQLPLPAFKLFINSDPYSCVLAVSNLNEAWSPVIILNADNAPKIYSVHLDQLNQDLAGDFQRVGRARLPTL
jgi:hypothetical protein